MKNYDPSQPSKYIMYLDANNLYGWAMSQALPYGEFAWESAENFNQHKILSIAEDSQEGYIFEVDLEYPKELHNAHNDYPLAAERCKIEYEQLSPFSKQHLSEEKYIPAMKLIPNLKEKKNYVCHYKNLQFYLRSGMTLKAVHKVLKFKQKAWLKPYIQFNTEKRKNASSLFEKDFFKLMNNAVYGKSLENTRKRKKIELVNNEKKGKKLVADPAFKRFKIFDHNLVAIERVKQTLELNRPIYLGFCILELSKVLMYDFHYNIIKEKYGSRANLLFTDTDSLTYEIQTEDLYKDLEGYKHILDTSDYPTEHPLYSTQNKKKIGCFKDEMNSESIIEFIGLRSKMYSILTEDGEKKTAKGVARSVIQKKLKHQHYKECLENMSISREIQRRITSTNHHIQTIEIKKISLSAYDDKRYILEDGYSTLAHGHYKIKELSDDLI